MVSRKDRSGDFTSEFLERVKEQFLGGKSMRQIELSNHLEGFDLPRLIRYLSHEFDLERNLRYDMTSCQLMQIVQQLSQRASDLAAAAKSRGLTSADTKELGDIQKLIVGYSATLDTIYKQKIGPLGTPKRQEKPAKKPEVSGAFDDVDPTERGAGPDDLGG